MSTLIALERAFVFFVFLGFGVPVGGKGGMLAIKMNHIIQYHRWEDMWETHTHNSRLLTDRKTCGRYAMGRMVWPTM